MSQVAEQIRPLSIELGSSDFHCVAELLYTHSGIQLNDGKKALVRSRLIPRVLDLRLPGFGEYLQRVSESPDEFDAMIDALTTNKTSFYRESAHFDYLRDRILPELEASGKPIRIWSAGCSTGQEPYTLAILLLEEMEQSSLERVKILATDISPTVLKTASRGVYSEADLEDVPVAARRKYFTEEKAPDRFRVRGGVRNMIRFARLNLMENWPMRSPFDLILCRNVMIYFDRPTQNQLVDRFAAALRPGAHLFVGHSESFTSSTTSVRYVQPSVYVK